MPAAESGGGGWVAQPASTAAAARIPASGTRRRSLRGGRAIGIERDYGRRRPAGYVMVAPPDGRTARPGGSIAPRRRASAPPAGAAGGPRGRPPARGRGAQRRDPAPVRADRARHGGAATAAE